MTSPPPLARLVSAALLLGAVVVALAPVPSQPSAARVADVWKVLSQGTVDNTHRVSLARRADGALQVLFTEPSATGTGDDLVLATMDPTTQAWTRTTVLAAYPQGPDPVLLSQGSMLKAVTSGRGQPVPGDPHSARLFELTSTDGGATWVNQPYALLQSTAAGASSGIAATLMPDGSTLAGFATQSSILWRNEQLANPDAASPDNAFTQLSCCRAHPNFVRVGDQVWASWHTNAPARSDSGAFVQQILPAAGPQLRMSPGYADVPSRDMGRMPMVVSKDGSAYLAYCSGASPSSGLGLHRIAADSAPGIAAPCGLAFDVATAADGGFWTSHVLYGSVWATLHNAGPDSGVYGTAQTPAKVEQLAISPAGDDLIDVVIVTGGSVRHARLGVPAWPTASPTPTDSYLGDDSKEGWRYLRLSLRPRSWVARRPIRVRAVVTGGPHAVQGASVVVRGKARCTTNKQGTCTLRLPAMKPGRVRVNASAGGYHPTWVMVRVKPGSRH